MALSAIVTASFERSFTLYRELIDSVEEGTLGLALPDLPSNTVGEQLWCVVGARESFAAAIEANEWSGFSCSLVSTTEKESVGEAMRGSADGVLKILSAIDSDTEVQNRLIVDLLEHEAAHHGQLIRYLYGLRLTIPESWKSRYNLS